jgi:hypothetical protein
MSLNKNTLKNSYNRAGNNTRISRDIKTDNMEYYWDSIPDEFWDDRGPSMNEVRIGWLLSLLEKLGLRAAREHLRHWYW